MVNPRTLATGTESRTTRHLLVIGLLTLLASAPSFTVAAPSAPEASSGQEQATESDDKAVAHQIELFRTAQVSLSRAIEIVERAHAGARTSDVSFDGGSGAPVYRVRTFHDGQLWEHAIDAATGEISTDRLVSSLKELNAEDRTNIASLSGVDQQLSDAVRVAERAASGKAISGGLTRERGKLSFVVIIVSGLDLKQVILEPPRRKSR
ncbi:MULTISPECIES: PepSY domain-containing protein [Bradyrhizobium]|uniref:PepSY domain-containing protein n=1 Tax=Bradyrhizobium elkanii TaxID=29448 RepID=UPI0007C471A5|nr:PepSY domain-containing protein [Bradyrhizobium elkanii]